MSQLADSLFDAGCIKFGTFTLKSGLTSPVYIDLRLLASYPALLRDVARAMAASAQDLVEWKGICKELERAVSGGGDPHQRPRAFHQRPPTPSQMTRLARLTTRPNRHHSPTSTYPAPKSTGAGPVP